MFCSLYFSLMKRNPFLKFIANVTVYKTEHWKCIVCPIKVMLAIQFHLSMLLKILNTNFYLCITCPYKSTNLNCNSSFQQNAKAHGNSWSLYCETCHTSDWQPWVDKKKLLENHRKVATTPLWRMKVKCQGPNKSPINVRHAKACNVKEMLSFLTLFLQTKVVSFWSTSGDTFEHVNLHHNRLHWPVQSIEIYIC